MIECNVRDAIAKLNVSFEKNTPIHFSRSSLHSSLFRSEICNHEGWNDGMDLWIE